MINKLTLLKRLFPKTILKKKKINKNKSKTFIIFCENNKLNWILFRNILLRSHYHFRLNPIFFVTDSMGEFDDLDAINSAGFKFNPLVPTFNIIKVSDLNFNEERHFHYDFTGIKYSIFWEQLENIKQEQANLLLFSDNIKELEKIIKTIIGQNREIVIFYLKQRNDVENVNINKYLSQFETWKINYNSKILTKWEGQDIFNIISEEIDIKKNKKIRKIRNKIFTIMNQHYKYGITPSYIDEEALFEDRKDNKELINTFYEISNKTKK